MPQIKKVITTIDSLLAIARDYTGGQIPADAKALRLMINPQERKIAIIAESDEWKHGMLPVGVKFHLKRVHAV